MCSQIRAGNSCHWVRSRKQFYGNFSSSHQDVELRKNSLNLSIFIVNNFYYVINCLINRFAIYRAKCLSIVTLKVLPTICFRYNSEDISSKFPIPKIKLNRIDMNASSIIKCSEDFEKMTGFHKSFCPFFWKRLHIHFNPSQNVSPILLLNGLVTVTNKGWIACKFFKKGNVRGYSL